MTFTPATAPASLISGPSVVAVVRLPMPAEAFEDLFGWLGLAYGHDLTLRSSHGPDGSWLTVHRSGTLSGPVEAIERTATDSAGSPPRTR